MIIEVILPPEEVVRQFVRLKQAGVDGLQLNFYGFQPDPDFFGERVLPLMHSAGLQL